jgi:tetratricopeptide (TPR) repeat protein
VTSRVRRGAALLAAALAIPAAASDEPDLARQYEVLEGQVRHVEQEYSRPDESQAQRAQRRFSEGEVQFLLESWEPALVRLYDAVEVPEFRASVDYPTAVYYVGESLYRQGEYRTARGWFRQLLASPGAPRQREALLRSLDIAIRTNDAAGVDLLLEQGRIAFGDRPPPELAYLSAKATATRTGLSRDERRRRAIAAFDAVPAPFQSRAAYWQGALLVEAGDLEGAAARFRACVELPGREARLLEVRELCHLALGRVYGDLGRFQDAADHYQEIPRESPRFEEALYELAWTWVRARKYEQALRAAALITDLSPDSPMAPEAAILQGHLLLRMGRYP